MHHESAESTCYPSCTSRSLPHTPRPSTPDELARILFPSAFAFLNRFKNESLEAVSRSRRRLDAQARQQTHRTDPFARRIAGCSGGGQRRPLAGMCAGHCAARHRSRDAAFDTSMRCRRDLQQTLALLCDAATVTKAKLSVGALNKLLGSGSALVRCAAARYALVLNRAEVMPALLPLTFENTPAAALGEAACVRFGDADTVALLWTRALAARQTRAQ